MTYEASSTGWSRWVASGLFLVVAAVLLAPVGLIIGGVLAEELGIQATSVTADTASDTVGATAAEFRVDESGAATYSIPIYGVPGTAGVAPKLALSYSSQSGYGPLGFDTAAYGAGQLASEAITGQYQEWQDQTGTALSFSRGYSYDTLGRGLGSTTTIDGANYGAAVQYDTLGRAWKAQDASGRWAKTAFNVRGMATHVCNSNATDVVTTCPADANTYLQTLETDAWGHVVKERRGNSAAMDVVRTYKPDTGRAWSICAGTSAGCGLMNEGYGWDANGNLHTQQKEGRYLEQFTYDDLNRLRTGTLTMQDGVTVNQVTQSFEYDALGNLCHRYAAGWASRDYTYIGRSGCGLGGTLNSTYGSGGTGTVGPHQVSGLVSGSQVLAHYYDLRGNQAVRTGPLAGHDRTMLYSLDDKAYEGALDTGARVRFWYGSDGGRYKRKTGVRVHFQRSLTLECGTAGCLPMR